MPPRERKRNVAALRNMEQLKSRRNIQEGTSQTPRSAHVMDKINEVVSFCWKLMLALLAPDRIWLLLFIPSFLRYMQLLRTSLRPHPLTIGAVIDLGGLEAVIKSDAKIEVVAEGLEGFLEAPLWRYDPELGRGYLLFSQVELNRLWRWEEGGGAFTIGRSLFLEHAGCQDRVLSELGKKSNCKSIVRSGVRGMSLGPTVDEGDRQAIYFCEGGHQRITKLEKNGTRTPVMAQVAYENETMCSLAISSDGGMYYTSLNKQGKVDIMYLPSLAEPRHSPVVIAADLASPSHIALTPDGSALFVSETKLGLTRWLIYETGDNPKKKLVTHSIPTPGEPGGMAVDSMGVLYAAFGETGVLVLDSSSRTHIGTVSTGSLVATDVALGDDGVLYITTRGTVLRIPTKSARSFGASS